MGVTGSGKSTVGARLAAQLGCRFYDGDDFHPASNVEKMRHGIPLTDEDRLPWLDRLREVIENDLSAGHSAVIACSALKNAYRERLMPHAPHLRQRTAFLYLKISPEAARKRAAGRPGHFAGPSLVKSQFEALEEPAGDESQNILTVDAESAPDSIVAIALEKLLGAGR